MDQRLLGLDDCGCVFDSHHGFYLYRMVCEWAQSLGWDGVVPDDAADDDSMVDDMVDMLVDASDEAMDWVNANRVTDGVSVGWWEGSVRLWSQADWEWAYGV